MLGLKNLLPLAVAAVLLAPGAGLADRKDREKQRGEKLEREYRGDDRRGRDGYYEGDYPGAYGYPGQYGDKEWRKEQKERDKEAREAWREAEKDRREAEREWAKDQREAERELFKAEREAQREYEKDRREADREWGKDRREARKEGRHRGSPFDPHY